ncbi:hypothetical protein N825_02640 [Skermanella stibiiresistens SB22]|jgi:hypothetical protein|uniref:Uncharacterized protein n=1 Tax=Skermanella stibiiresistens SB22 TaxID=1385369 RepID=W9H9C9_9PROT|nr:hypothetical protein [Skermanella stibiiresistens]EWY42885.1 hypothetical protein N825_02640 [Skermanella stibiiresistens SB22]
MQVQASGVGPASGYASQAQATATRPQATPDEQQSGGAPTGGVAAGAGPENNPVTDPSATRGRIVNISV